MEDGPQARQDALNTAAARRRFIEENTAFEAPSLVPEVRLHLASEALPLWQKTEDALEREGLPPPFWAFAWAGGQALARYILDNPATVAGKRVLEVGAGSGLVAIAAAQAGAAHVRANDLDPFSLDAMALNAAANGVSIDVVSEDVLDGTPVVDVLLIADLFYEKSLSARAAGLGQRAQRNGAQVLIGDPGRTYLPKDLLEPVAKYSVPTPRALEDADVKAVSIFRFAGRLADEGPLDHKG